MIMYDYMHVDMEVWMYVSLCIHVYTVHYPEDRL